MRPAGMVYVYVSFLFSLSASRCTSLLFNFETTEYLPIYIFKVSPTALHSGTHAIQAHMPAKHHPCEPSRSLVHVKPVPDLMLPGSFPKRTLGCISRVLAPFEQSAAHVAVSSSRASETSWRGIFPLYINSFFEVHDHNVHKGKERLESPSREGCFYLF